MPRWIQLGLLAAGVASVALQVVPLAEQVNPPQGGHHRVIEIRSYNLKPGTRDRFHQTFPIVVSLDAATINDLRQAGGVNHMANQASTATDLELLTRLNADYITSVQKGDVRRFDEILADDFLCSMADGSLIDRKRFLEVTAQPVTIRDLQAHDVNIRVMGDMAIVHAATSFTTADGRPSSGRYTDVWAKRGGKWLAVSAHVTRK